MFKGFKEFIMRGNVLDMAVGIIVGAAFGKIVSSFVNDLLMPPLGKLLGNVNFSDLFINLSDKSYDTLTAAKAAGAATLNYGVFINSILDFIIIAFAIYLLIKSVSRFKKAEAPATKDCPLCCNAIPLAAKKCGHCTADLG